MARNDTHDDSAPVRKRRRRRRGDGAFVGGTALILIGALALVDQFGWLQFRDLWPLILIGVGIAMIATYAGWTRRAR